MSVAALVVDRQTMLAPDQARKARETLVARGALKGVQLVRLADGSWLAEKWGMFKSLPNDLAVDTWLRRVEGRTG